MGQKLGKFCLISFKLQILRISTDNLKLAAYNLFNLLRRRNNILKRRNISCFVRGQVFFNQIKLKLYNFLNINSDRFSYFLIVAMEFNVDTLVNLNHN
jgi:hypothetical protein